MQYRFDWSVLFRTNRQQGAERMLNQMRKIIGCDLAVSTFQPYTGERGFWDCEFTIVASSTAFMEAVVECIRIAQLLSKNWKWGRINEKNETFWADFFTNERMGGTCLIGLVQAHIHLVHSHEPFTPPEFPMITTEIEDTNYTVWIETEPWDENECLEADSFELEYWKQVWSSEDTTQVFVTFENKIRWYAFFMTYKYIDKLRNECRESGKYLRGKYCHFANTILIDDLSRDSIESVIQDMLDHGKFTEAFQWIGEEYICPDDDDDCCE